MLFDREIIKENVVLGADPKLLLCFSGGAADIMTGNCGLKKTKPKCTKLVGVQFL